MAYGITDTCIKDSLCVDVCPTDYIHPKQDEPGFEAATQTYVDPEGLDRRRSLRPGLPLRLDSCPRRRPRGQKDFVEKNAAFFKH